MDYMKKEDGNLYQGRGEYGLEYCYYSNLQQGSKQALPSEKGDRDV